MVESQKKKNGVSSNSSTENKDSKTSSPVDKKKRSEFSEDEGEDEAPGVELAIV